MAGNIGIDARTVYAPILKGMGVYLYNLLVHLSRIDQENEYILYYDSRQTIQFRLPESRNFLARGISIKKGDRYHVWELLRLPLEVYRDRVQLFHSPANTVMFVSLCPVIATVHDTTAQEMKKNPGWEAFYLNKIQPAAVRKIAKIMTPSQYSKERIADIFKVKREKIEVVPNGISDLFRILEDKEKIEEVRKKFSISGDYILNVGGESSWKNVVSIIRAYAQLVKNSARKESLVVIGIRKKSILDDHVKLAMSLGVEKKVFVLGYVSEEELVALYNGAKIFVYPSLREGFGFPPLEAMACGVPVVASNATSIPEVVSDAAVLVDATQIELLTAAMLQVLEDEFLRASLIEKGLKQCRKFSWQNTAERTLQIYRDVVRNHKQ